MPYYIECYNCIYFKKLPMFFSKGKCDNPASEKYQKEMHETENCDRIEFKEEKNNEEKEPKKIFVLTKSAGIEFGMCHNSGVWYITENKEAADILATAGCNLEEWSLVTLKEAKGIKERYERMKEHERGEKELEYNEELD